MPFDVAMTLSYLDAYEFYLVIKLTVEQHKDEK